MVWTLWDLLSEFEKHIFQKGALHILGNRSWGGSWVGTPQDLENLGGSAQTQDFVPPCAQKCTDWRGGVWGLRNWGTGLANMLP